MDSSIKRSIIRHSSSELKLSQQPHIKRSRTSDYANHVSRGYHAHGHIQKLLRDQLSSECAIFNLDSQRSERFKRAISRGDQCPSCDIVNKHGTSIRSFGTFTCASTQFNAFASHHASS